MRGNELGRATFPRFRHAGPHAGALLREDLPVPRRPAPAVAVGEEELELHRLAAIVTPPQNVSASRSPRSKDPERGTLMEYHFSAPGVAAAM